MKTPDAMEKTNRHFIEFKTLFTPEDAPDYEATGVAPDPDDLEEAPMLWEATMINGINPATDPRDCKLTTPAGDRMVRESYKDVKERLKNIPGVTIWD